MNLSIRPVRSVLHLRRGIGGYPSRRVAAVAFLALAGASAYMPGIQDWYMHWGATADEIAAVLPGDDLLPQDDPAGRSTRAITVAAPPERIWPWLMQMGQGRGGLYSYEWLENLIGCDIHNAERIVPEWQNPQPGDPVRIYPDGKGPPPYRVAAIRPNEALILGHQADVTTYDPDGQWTDTWQFVLRPVDEAHTRLLIRTRTAHYTPIFRAIAPGVFVMERGMLRGIRERAERLDSAQ